MKSVFCLLFLAFGIAKANPIITEPVNPSVTDGIPKIMEAAQSIPLANSVQSVPVVPIVQNVPVVAVDKVSPVKSVEPVVASANVPVLSYASKVDPVVSKVSDVPVGQPSVVVPSVVVPVKQLSPVPVDSVVSPVQEQVVPVNEQVAPVQPQVSPVAGSKVAPVAVVDSVEKNSVDPSAILSGPIDQATKLVMDLDEHIKKYLPAEDEIATTIAPHIYAGDVAESEAERQQNQMSALIDQVNRLAESIENTITDLVARRRYVTAAMLRSMLNYVRRVRVNLERLQNRLQSVQAVATSGQNSPQGGSSSPGSNIPGAAFFNTIRDRINRMTEEIGALVTRIRGSFTPGSAVSTSPLPPLVTAANLENIGAAAASGSIVSAINTVNSVPQNVAAAVVAKA